MPTARCGRSVSPLAYGGCRLAEALALTADRVDLAGGVLVFDSVKKRRSGVYRAAPVPPSVLDALDLVHGCPATKKVVAGMRSNLLGNDN